VIGHEQHVFDHARSLFIFFVRGVLRPPPDFNQLAGSSPPLNY
jgi:hypothetical protein